MLQSDVDATSMEVATWHVPYRGLLCDIILMRVMPLLLLLKFIHG